MLYKSENETIEFDRFKEERYPQLYIDEASQEAAGKELLSQLKSMLVKSIKSGDLHVIKSALIEIAEESLGDQQDLNLPALPETIDIMYDEYSQGTSTLKGLTDIDYAGYSLVEHSVNVMVFKLNYSIFYELGEKSAKRLSLGALTHDIGLTKIPENLISLDRKFTDKEFGIYKT